jgi:hypothetical protein
MSRLKIIDMSVFHPNSNAVERRNFVLFSPFKYLFPLGYLTNNYNNKCYLLNTDSLTHYIRLCIVQWRTDGGFGVQRPPPPPPTPPKTPLGTPLVLWMFLGRNRKFCSMYKCVAVFLPTYCAMGHFEGAVLAAERTP